MSAPSAEAPTLPGPVTPSDKGGGGHQQVQVQALGRGSSCDTARIGAQPACTDGCAGPGSASAVHRRPCRGLVACPRRLILSSSAVAGPVPSLLSCPHVCFQASLYLPTHFWCCAHLVVDLHHLTNSRHTKIPLSTPLVIPHTPHYVSRATPTTRSLDIVIAHPFGHQQHCPNLTYHPPSFCPRATRPTQTWTERCNQGACSRRWQRGRNGDDCGDARWAGAAHRAPCRPPGILGTEGSIGQRLASSVTSDAGRPGEAVLA